MIFESSLSLNTSFEGKDELRKLNLFTGFLFLPLDKSHKKFITQTQPTRPEFLKAVFGSWVCEGIYQEKGKC